MRRAFEEWVYGLTMRGDWVSRVVSPIWFHWYCPYPLSRNWTARRCVSRGDCGCDNGPRLARRLKEINAGDFHELMRVMQPAPSEGNGA